LFENASSLRPTRERLVLVTPAGCQSCELQTRLVPEVRYETVDIQTVNAKVCNVQADVVRRWQARTHIERIAPRRRTDCVDLSDNPNPMERSPLPGSRL
jgi:hypothetical protein